MMQNHKARENVVKLRMNEEELYELNYLSNELNLNKSDVIRMGLKLMIKVADEYRRISEDEVK